MKIVVSYDLAGLKRFTRAAADLGSPRLWLGMARALNKVGDKARTQVRRALRNQMGMKRYGVIVSNTTTIPANPGRLEYTIIGKGKGLPIREFPVREVSKGVEASPWRRSRLFKRSFAIGGRYRAKLGPKRFPIRALHGPAIAKEIVKDEAAELVPQLSAAINRLLP